MPVQMGYPTKSEYDDCATVAVRQAQVREKLDSQEKALAYLTENLNQLDTRLQCACVPQPPQPDMNECPKDTEFLCDLAKRINNYATRIFELAEWIASLNKRLEL